LRSAGTVTAPGRASRNALLPPGTFHTVRSPFTPPFLERSHDGKPNRVPTTGEACRVATPGPPTGPDGARRADGDGVAGDRAPPRARRGSGPDLARYRRRRAGPGGRYRRRRRPSATAGRTPSDR